MSRPARRHRSALAALALALAVTGCSNDGSEPTSEPATTTAAPAEGIAATPENIAAFCAAYEEAFEASDPTEADELFAEALPLAPTGIRPLLDQVEAADAAERFDEAQELRGEIADWQSEHCEGSATTTTTAPAPADAQTLAWCENWAFYLDRQDADQAATYLANVVDLAPDAVADRVGRYRDGLDGGDDVEDLETEINGYWHDTCPGGTTGPGATTTTGG